MKNQDPSLTLKKALPTIGAKWRGSKNTMESIPT